ncbi:MAG: glycosyltransferase family 2 protein [Bacteroidales bacterium]|nr:glycosyltransferase family 2 protein [Bacteroidales bacterium]
MRDLPLCFIVPFYNNGKTVGAVITGLKEAGYSVIAVNDGSTDSSLEKAREANPDYVVSYARNRGKGYALRQGFKAAWEEGFRYAMVFDADGQHTLTGAKAMIEAALELPEKERERTIIIGSRNTRGADGGGKFANNFSNFWLTVQTGKKMGDTQSGMRLYPLEKIDKVHFLGNRYEFETEILVRMAWRGFRLMEVPVDVIYPEDRVTHFRRGADFTRISLMNTFLTGAAVFYGYPRMLIEKLRRR